MKQLTNFYSLTTWRAGRACIASLHLTSKSVSNDGVGLSDLVEHRQVLTSSTDDGIWSHSAIFSLSPHPNEAVDKDIHLAMLK